MGIHHLFLNNAFIVKAHLTTPHPSTTKTEVRMVFFDNAHLLPLQIKLRLKISTEISYLSLVLFWKGALKNQFYYVHISESYQLQRSFPRSRGVLRVDQKICSGSRTPKRLMTTGLDDQSHNHFFTLVFQNVIILHDV